MTDTVKVKVLRAHSGDYGSKAEGDTYETSRGHANALAGQNLVKVLGEKAEEAPANKSEPAPANKAEKKGNTK
ncbi:MAG: hypothetical protein JWQ03_3124 [Variovorax sp.]|nr:hypothetical protein [Variovorax sp.]